MALVRSRVNQLIGSAIGEEHQKVENVECQSSVEVAFEERRLSVDMTWEGCLG